VAASFDGASNMSGVHAAVQALLKKSSPSLIFVHCRSHLLQLALVRAANTVTEIKRVLNLLSKLYALFSHSPLRLNIFKHTLEAMDGMYHKLVQPGATRWLSYEGSVAVVMKHYSAICVALEAIYVEAGDMASDAGGILLTLRKASTLQFLAVLSHFLQPLARLSKTLQSSNLNTVTAMSVAKATVASLIDDFDMSDIANDVAGMKNEAVAAGVRMEEDMSSAQIKAVTDKFHKSVINNLEQRFSDEVSQLCEVNQVCKVLTRQLNDQSLTELI